MRRLAFQSVSLCSLLLAGLLAPAPAFGGCDLPAKWHLARATYPLERIDASLTIRIDFPDWKALPCEAADVAFGRLWTFELPAAIPIELVATGLNGHVVQRRKIYGTVRFKETATWAELSLSFAKWDAFLSDHRLSHIHLWSQGTLLPTPAISLSDQGVDRRLAAKLDWH